MTDFEETNGYTDPADEPTGDGQPTPSPAQEVTPEYVRDLLSRLRETMAVIKEEEQSASPVVEEVIPPSPILEEEELPAADAEEDTAAEEDAPAAEETAEDDTPPWEAPAADAEEDTAAEEDAPAAEETAEDDATAVEPPSPSFGDTVMEELSLSGAIDALIAEANSRERRDPPPMAFTASRADAVTEELMAAATAAPAAESAPTAESAPVAESATTAEPAASESPAPAPAGPDGIWAMASVASEAAAAEKKAKRRRFRARLVRVRGIPVEEIPTVREVGEPTPLFTEEPAVAEEGIGTLRPQDFFIADLRHEEELHAGTAEEYVSRNQIETILRGYAEERKQVSLRFFLSLALSLFVLVFENLPLLGISVCGLFGIAPRIYTLLDIGLLAVAMLLALDVIKDGVRELFAWEFGTPAITLLSSGVSVILLVMSLIFGTAEAAPLCALPAVLTVTMALGFSRMHIRDEEKTFLHLCESGDKLAAEILPAAYATEESASLGRRVRNVLRVKKVGFVTGYFSRVKQKREDYRLQTVLALVSLGLLLGGTLVYALLAPASSVASVLSFSSWLIAPLSSAVYFAARRLPFHHLVERADIHGTAVLGEAAAEEYASVDVVAFEDVEAYPSRKVRVRRIKMYDNSRLDELLYYMASVFSVLGGPLDGVFRVSASELGISDRVTIHATAPEGLDATVDGHRILIGKWGYYPKATVEPYYDSEDVYKEDAGNISIVYVSVDGTIGAKLYIEYNLSRRFEKTVRRLRRHGIATLVRSFDPSIGDNLLATTVHYPGLTIRSVRKKPDGICDFAEARVDSGLVTGAGSRDLLYTFLLCQSYRRVTAIGRILKIASLPLTLLASVLIPLLSRVPTFFSVYAAGLGLFWLLPILFVSHFYFKNER